MHLSCKLKVLYLLFFLLECHEFSICYGSIQVQLSAKNILNLNEAVAHTVEQSVIMIHVISLTQLQVKSAISSHRFIRMP